MKAGTFHRTALGLLREHRELRGRPLPQLLPDRRRLLADVTTGDPRRTGLSTGRSAGPRRGSSPRTATRPRRGGTDVDRGISPEQVADAYARYESERTRRRLLDFDDLIVACADALAGDREFADSIRWRTRHLFVDEMQDVNPAQFRLLTAMLADEPDLFVVGDPNQSVYGFNGADPTLLDRLPEILRGTTVIRLDENHRCTPQVVAVATAVLREGGAGAAVVAPRTTRIDGPVPKVVTHATDDDEAAWAAAQAKMSRTPGRPWSSIAVLTRTNAQLAKVQVAMDAARVPSLIAGADLGPASDLRAESGRRGPRPGRGGGRAEEPVDRDRVVLTTFHRAKGLQWPTVIVVGLHAGLMPIASAQTPAAVDEERRLLYVALTRSEEELWCSWSERAATRRRRGAGAEPVAGAHRAGDRSAGEGGGADRGAGGLGPCGGTARAGWREGADAAVGSPVGSVRPIDPRWGWTVVCRNSWSSYVRPWARATSSRATRCTPTTPTTRRSPPCPSSPSQWSCPARRTRCPRS